MLISDQNHVTGLPVLLHHLEPLDQTLQSRLEQVLAVLPAGAVPHDVQRLLDDLLPWVQQSFGIAQWRAEVPDMASAADHLDGPDDPVYQLTQRFALDPFERDLLLLCALLALDSRYSTVIACLQMDMHKSQLTVDCAVSLLSSGLAEQLARRASVSTRGTLVRHGLLQLRQAPNTAAGAAVLTLEPGVLSFLLGEEGALVELEACARWLEAPAKVGKALTPLARALAEDLHEARGGARPVLLLRGRAEDGRGALVAFSGTSVGLATLELNLELLPEADAEAWPLLVQALRETRMRHAVLLLLGAAAFAEARKVAFARLCARLNEHRGPVVCLNQVNQPGVRLGLRPHVLLEMPERSAADDEKLLRTQMLAWGGSEGIDLAQLVRRFSLSAESVDGALAEADLYRQRRDGSSLDGSDLNRALRLRAQQDFGKLAQRVEPRRGFTDLVAEPALIEQLREILGAVRQRQDALSGGFQQKIAYGTGLSALFHGDSGTGKTMAAEVLAYELGVDLIKIDLSTVVNKYIGETEKHLARIFDLAEQDAGVLFFDEADALFGKRSEAKDAHDRHANIEVSYLLQRLESFDGLVILCTNNRANLDAAFNRRLTFAARFSHPSAALREQLWRAIWPANAQPAVDVDLAALARKYDITGANIRNAALLATWLAREEGATRIHAQHIERALKREMSKIGRVLL